MKKELCIIFAILMILSFCSCGGEEDLKAVPGTLCGIYYDRTNGSVANADFHIYVTPYNFVAEYLPENEDEWIYDEDSCSYVMSEKKSEISEEEWKEIEKTFLAVYPEITPMKAKESFLDKIKKKFIAEPTILDGGDKISVKAEWQTEEGIVTEVFNAPQGENSYRFDLILKELADPIGREIPELKKNE